MDSPDRNWLESSERSFRTKPSLRALGVAPNQEHADSGGGTTVYKVTHFPYGACALKVLDLSGSEHITIYGVDNYKKDTNTKAHDVHNMREDLILRTFRSNDGDMSFRWRVNPIYTTGLVRLQEADHVNRTVPYTLSPWVNGVSLGDLFSHADKLPSDYAQLTRPDVVTFLRQEFERFSGILRFENFHNNLQALNVLVSPRNRENTKHDLVITNLREYMFPRHHPIALLRGRW